MKFSTMRSLVAGLVISSLGLYACGEQATDGDGGSGAQAGAGGSAGHGAGGGGGTDGQGGAELCPNEEFGFQFRKPGDYEILCDYYPPGFIENPISFTDIDWLCTFDYNGTQGYVYIQSTPVSCQIVMSPIATYTAGKAQISINGNLTDLTNASYSWGGNHHNDSLSFDYNGYSFKYYHSSFGTGWRACQPMDCLQVHQGGQLVEDGCTVDRTLPVVCEQIGADCSHDALDDDFAPCTGDPNYP